MNLAGWRFLVFALAGAGAIVLLASLGTPRAYTLEYPGAIDARERATWNFRILRALLASLLAKPRPEAP